MVENDRNSEVGKNRFDFLLIGGSEVGQEVGPYLVCSGNIPGDT